MYPQPTDSPINYRTSGGGQKILTIILLVLMLAGSSVFGYWAYKNMQDYKNNSDKKAVQAVAKAKQEQAALLQAQFNEQSKSPIKTFRGSPTYGSVSFNYPKTWSAYVDSTNSNQPINAYFHPGEVPGVQSRAAYALRVELLNTEYSQIMQQYTSQASQNRLSIKAYVPPKMQGAANVTAGSYLSGEINTQNQGQRGNMLVIKVRDKTLKVSTESPEFAADFNKIVLESLTFAP